MTVTTDPRKTGIPAFQYLGDFTQATLPAAATGNSGYMARITDFGDNGAFIYSNGTRWNLVSGRSVIAKQGAEVTGITATPVRVLRGWLPATWPKDNDDIQWEFTASKSGGVDAGTMSVYVGPTGDSTDTVVTGYSAFSFFGATNRTLGFAYAMKRLSATSMKKVGNGAAGATGLGAASTTFHNTATVVPNMDSAGCWISIYFASAAASDTLSIYTSELRLHTP